MGAAPSWAQRELRPTRPRSGLRFLASWISLLGSPASLAGRGMLPALASDHIAFASARLSRGFSRQLCRNGENSRSRESHSGNVLESGRWGLAKCRLVSLAEALQLSETEAVGNFCDVCVVRIGVTQRAAQCLQPTQQHILNGAHTEKIVCSISVVSGH